MSASSNEPEETRPARKLRFEIFRYDPARPGVEPHLDRFELEEQPYMTLYIALNRIREEQDPSLQFDFACRSAVCGSCGMMINGRPGLACSTLTAKLPDEIRLHPLPAFKLVGDLSVDTGTWFRGMAEQVEAWVHERAPFDPEAPEERMDDDLAQAIYEGERCIECGCCVAGCGVANVRPTFVGPAGLNRIARFALDPRDARGEDEWFELVAHEDGVFGCLGLMACHDVCPKELPLLDQYAYLRRKVLGAGRSDLLQIGGSEGDSA
ncbi:MAG: fumarate reductase iron-sulfur subunit [Myxococcota bacterium]|nr:fumarate reductase iron-sulfur subunit [Myxococcota bacterium]